MEKAVVSASLGAMGPLLGKLTGLLAGVYGRLKGVRREILVLKCELSSMHAAVQKFAILEDPDIQVKQWISMVRELAYDTEDCIDKFIHRLGKRGRHGGFKESFQRIARSLKMLGARHGMAGQIEELKARIKHVKELKDSYKLDDTLCSTIGHAVVDPRLHALFAEEAHLVGVEGPRDDLVKWMVKEEDSMTMHDLKVLSIVGFGGLGKTTLANEVYRKIKGGFDCLAFVSVSQKPDIRKIIRDVISQVSGQDGGTDNWDERKCIEKLRELLQYKRYLVIIDDIWSTPTWDAIKCAFPENKYSSRILVTTCIIDVARSCSLGGGGCVYAMEALSDLHSQNLFLRRIFGSVERCPDMLKEVSYQILKKCGGLPLAIISISSLLANIPVVKEEWEKIKRSIGSALVKNRSLEGMSSILSLSYNYLSPNLKTCLMYLSAFPEDHEIERKHIVRLWIAEGFIPEERGQSQQDIAEHYFYELINKSMVQPMCFQHDGDVSSCRVHDLMLEILISKSAEDNFITILGSGQASLENRPGVIRRLSIHYIDQQLASALANEDLTHVRSLIITGSSYGINHLPSLDKFEVLRVLDSPPRYHLQEYIMKGLEKLFKLKYLRLMDGRITKLPPGIVRLCDLETLDLSGTDVEVLPFRFSQLIRLQHLFTDRKIKIPNGIGGMMNLRAVSAFDVTQSPVDVVEDLGNLNNLNRLEVELDSGFSEDHKGREEMLLSTLSKLVSCKLKYLTIIRKGGSLEFLDSWSPLPYSLQSFDLSSVSCFMNFPKWIVPTLSNLSVLRLKLVGLTMEHLQTLGELPALLDLLLLLETGPKDRLVIQDNYFPCLKVFRTTAGKGTHYTIMKGAMPNLEILRLSVNVSVAKMYGFNTGIEHLACLRRFNAFLHSEGATTSDDTPEAAATRMEAAAAFRSQAAAHPNHPTVIIMDRIKGEYIDE